ncbi:vacuole membrane protein KMS1 [Andrographis paniculata]|uniref:vacuole membrane protein KMS1 n=1 Tax=Andrographis paniculata TaxID=175694 RepID=UPI0021E6E119|nr:vacuole membrane protein KMS1 [Andrographis paniculata]
MRSKKKSRSSSRSSRSSRMTIAELRTKHQQELENLTLTSQPFKTLKLFTFATVQYLTRSIAYILSHGWLKLLSAIVGIAGVLLVTVDGFHNQHVEEVLRYAQYGLWWITLGVASSIGLGSGLHTFVLYLGPHIAFFTIKAVQCGRVDLKSALYDTIQLKRSPSWLDKGCAEFGPPLFEPSQGVRIPLSSILPYVQLEAVLWGIGTALGELPPYFISRAASLSGGKMNAMEDLDASSAEETGFISARLNQIKLWFLSRAQYLNFFSILLLASVPNPLFDLAGIMCGQFGIPFWEFFLATMIGKALIKTHIQTVFIISVCNNQLLHWIENELIWVLGFIPGFNSILPNLISKLHALRNKYMTTKPNAPVDLKVKKWDFSVAFIWNTIVWIMLMNFFVKIVNATAQQQLKKQQDHEIALLKNKASKGSDESDTSSR